MDDLNQIEEKYENEKRKEISALILNTIDKWSVAELRLLYLHVKADGNVEEKAGELSEDAMSIKTAKVVDPNAMDTLLSKLIFTKASTDIVAGSGLYAWYKEHGGNGSKPLFYDRFEEIIGPKGGIRGKSSGKVKYVGIKWL